MRDLTVPIPGMSLTEDSRSMPYTNPPKMTDPEAVLQSYLQKLENPKLLDALMMGLENGATVKQTTEGILRMGVSRGIHSIDVSMLIAPIIHEKIAGAAKAMKIDFDDGFGEEEEEAEFKAMRDKDVKMKVLKKLKEPAPAMPEPEPEEEVEPKESKGLVKRRKK